MDEGRTNVSDELLTVTDEVIIDWTAKDDRRQGVAQFCRYISVRDMHAEGKSLCTLNTPVPFLDWLSLQFLQTDLMQCDPLHCPPSCELRVAEHPWGWPLRSCCIQVYVDHGRWSDEHTACVCVYGQQGLGSIWWTWEAYIYECDESTFYGCGSADTSSHGSRPH